MVVIILFESCVVLDGNQTRCQKKNITDMFESCVVLDGNQTYFEFDEEQWLFESCVVLDGNQTERMAKVLVY